MEETCLGNIFNQKEIGVYTWSDTKGPLSFRSFNTILLITITFYKNLEPFWIRHYKLESWTWPIDRSKGGLLSVCSKNFKPQECHPLEK